MTIPDTPDWSGQKVDLSVSQQIGIAVATLPTPISTDPHDCSAWKSLSLYVQLVGQSGYTPCLVQVVWYQAGEQVGVDTIGIIDGEATASESGTLFWQIPCRGDQFSLATFGGPDGDVIQVIVYGSTRQLAAESVQSSQGQDIQLGAYAVLAPLAVNQSAIYYMGPFVNGVDVYFYSSRASVNLSVFGLTYDSAVPVSAQTGAIIGTASGVFTASFPARRMPVKVVVFNGSGAAANYSLTAIGR